MTSNSRAEELFKLVLEINNKTGDIQRDLGVLATKLDDSSARIQKLEDKEELLEKDVAKIKNNWGWLVAIVSAAGSIAGYIVQIIIHVLAKG